MSTENNIGVQTRAMAQWVDNNANPEQVQKTTDQATTPTVELHKTKEDTIKEFVRQYSTINLDWYVPDLCNTRVSNLIEKRLQLGTTEGRILFSSPALNEFFKTSNFELNLQTGEVLTYLDPPENIGITCQKEPFDIESLRDTLQGQCNTDPTTREASSILSRKENNCYISIVGTNSNALQVVPRTTREYPTSTAISLTQISFSPV